MPKIIKFIGGGGPFEEDEYFAKTTHNQESAPDDPDFSLYSGASGQNEPVGGILKDNPNNYLVIGTRVGNVGTTVATGACLNRIYEGDGAFTDPSPGVPGGSILSPGSYGQGGASTDYAHSVLFTDRHDSSRPAEWGFWHGNANSGGGGSFMQMGTLVVLPFGEDGFLGPTIPSTRSVRGTLGNVIPYATAADTDTESDATVLNFPEGGEYLLIASLKVAGADSASGAYRFTITMDDNDLYDVKTNTATGGAIRTGRGFQYQLEDNASSQQVQVSCAPIRVMNISAGDHTFKIVANKHDNGDDDFDRINGAGIVAIRTDVFDQFDFIEDTNSVSVTSTTLADWNEGVTVTGDGETQMLIGVSTTAHTDAPAQGILFNLTRNGTTLMNINNALSAFYETGDGNPGAADSDNNTMPFCIYLVDTPPPGVTNYKFQYAVEGTDNSLMNTNDNGASGFRGTMFVASLATT